MLEILIKGTVYVLGFIATSVVFLRILNMVPKKLRKIIKEEVGYDIVLEVKYFTKFEEKKSNVKAKSYLIQELENLGIQLYLKSKVDENDECEECYLLGVDEKVCMKTAEQMKLKRRLKDDIRQWQVYTRKNALEFEDEFNSGERVRILQHLLDDLRTPPKEKAHGDCEIPMPYLQDDALLHKGMEFGMISKLYPLHEDIEREDLMENWVKDKSFTKNQPLDKIRLYYGDQVGFYFGFLECYTTWLIIPSILGCIVFITQIVWGVENPFTALYAVVMAIWATSFLEYWKRTESDISWRWGLFELGDIERERAGFRGDREYDEIEEKYVTTFSNMNRAKRYMFTIPTIFAALIAVVAITFGFFQLKTWSAENITEEKGWTGYSVYIGMLPTIFYSLAVMVMDTYYLDLAVKLNEYENHRTESEYANAYVMKLASFYFVNNFGLLFYIAFFVRDFALLQQTLSSLLVTRQVVGNVQETLIPYILTNSSIKERVGLAKGIKRAEKGEAVSKVDTEVRLPEYAGTFDDFLELFVQFGQVTLFAAAYPLAAICSLANNIIEKRSDGFKLCTAHQRPLPVQCSGIGAWLMAFEVLGYVAVLTNCTLVGFNSGQLEKLFPSLTHSMTIVIIVMAEHILMCIKLIIQMAVPDVPSHILDAQKREKAALRKQNERASNTTMDMVVERGHAIEFGKVGSEQKLIESKKSELAEVIESKSPQEWMRWVEDEINRRQQLEKEVKHLSDIYMQWVGAEQSRRQSVENELEQIKSKKSD